MPIYDLGTPSRMVGGRAIDGMASNGVSSGVGGTGKVSGSPALADRAAISQDEQNRQLATKKIYRPDYGYAMTDFEYAQQKQIEGSNQIANRPMTHQTGSSQTYQQPPSYSEAAMSGLGSAGPAVSNYTGQPTSNLSADRARMELEAEYAQRALANQAGIQSQQMKDSAALQAEAEARRLGYMPQIMAQLPGMVSRGGGGPDPNEAAARAAAFARAKEQAGGTALSALRALNNQSAERGQTGSSMERGMIGNVVGDAASQVNEYSRDQLMADLQRAAQLSDMEYQGNITQRGQNMALTPAMLALVGQRAVY